MSLMSALRRSLYDPRVRDLDVDDNELLEIHRQILYEKKIMRNVFEDFYDEMTIRCDKYLVKTGLEIELGSGSGFFKDVRDGLVTSDIRNGDHIDRVLDAQNMDLDDSTVRCLYAINLFHHLPDPEKFFHELSRTLAPGGGCVLIEPHFGPVSGFIHSWLHKDEHFDKQAKCWQTEGISGPLSGANQALAYLVFHRDKQLFQEKFGAELEILESTPLSNGIRYLASGGVNFRQLVPDFLEPILKATECLLSPFANTYALHNLIVIRRKS